MIASTWEAWGAAGEERRPEELRSLDLQRLEVAKPLQPRKRLQC